MIGPTKTRARLLDRKIREGASVTRTGLIMLGEFLHEAFEERIWELLGFPNRKEWLASPGLELSESSAQAVAQVWRETVIDCQLDPVKLEGIDVRKVQIVLPAVRDGRIKLEVALRDCRTLSRRETALKYGESEASGRAVLRGAISAVTAKSGQWEQSRAEEVAYAAAMDRPDLHDELLKYAVRAFVQEEGRAKSHGRRIYQRSYKPDGRRVNKPWTALTLFELRELAQAYYEQSRANAERAHFCDALFGACVESLGERNMRTTTVGEFLSTDDVAEVAEGLALVGAAA